MKKGIGYVALLDILGFREFVGREEGLTDLNHYTDAIATLLEPEQEYLQYVLFSDTVVINTLDDSAGSFKRIVNACSALLSKLIRIDVAARGAISYGPFIRSTKDKHGVILAGRPIVEAFDYEKSQEWVGVMLTPSVLRRMPQIDDYCPSPDGLRQQSLKALLERYPLLISLKKWPKIPFHSIHPHAEYSMSGYAVVPMDAGACTPIGVSECLNALHSRLERMALCAPTPEAQQKYRNTQAFLWNQVCHNWQQFPT